MITSFTVATDWICSFPGQSLHFPGDGLSHSITLRPRSAEGCCSQWSPWGTGWQGLRQRRRQRRDHCSCGYLLVSYSLCHICYCLTILRIIRFIYYLIYLFLAHFNMSLKQFPSVSQKASACPEPLRPPLLWSRREVGKWPCSIPASQACHA